MAIERREMVILTGNSHPDLAEEVTRHLDGRLSPISVYHRTNRETIKAKS